jgi:hypothetical protein
MKSTNRVKNTGEIFTPPALVDEILDKLDDTDFHADKTFLDPACGDGAFLKGVKNKLLDKGIRKSKIINHQLFGCDLMLDNVMDCIFNIVSNCPTDTIYEVKRYDTDHKNIKNFEDTHDELWGSRYVSDFKNNKVLIYRTTPTNIRLLNNKCSKDKILEEMKSGTIYLNVKFPKKEPFTYTNIVCGNSLEYEFTFGRK